MKYKINKGFIVRKIKDLPIAWYFYKLYTERLLKYRLDATQTSAEKVFTDIYNNNNWNNTESVSGHGSELKNTQAIIDKLPAFLKKYNVKSILDAPCGDFNWMKYVQFKDVKYTGGDIVQALVDLNNQRYGNPQISFIKLDIIQDPLPKVDLIFVRDCLVHFNDKNIKSFLLNLIQSDIKYLMTTNFPLTKHNYDITMGNFRLLNLQRQPYNLPKEVDVLWEECKENYGQVQDKSLILFEVKEIKNQIHKILK
ncbi:MAG: class I SAM-dependent methyltransferase [Bacteroidia bacterium]|jgi:SAM-dependent methyltransferase|nr:class I SAM-dependent methyltransferase [Bacteroidia bacterium]